MSVSGISSTNQTQVGSVQNAGGGFDINAGQDAGCAGGAQGKTEVNMSWDGMDKGEFTDLAEQAGMDPTKDGEAIGAAFDKAAKGAETISPDAFMDAFGPIGATETADGISVDNAQFAEGIKGMAAEDSGLQGFAPQAQPVPGSEAPGGVEGADGAKGAGGCGAPEAGGAPGAGGAEEAGAAQGASGPQGAGEAQNLLTSADRNKDGKIDINELKDFLRQAGVPEEQVDQLAQKLMAEGGGPEGLTPQNLTRALQEAGGDISTKEGIKEALNTIAAGGADAQSGSGQEQQPGGGGSANQFLAPSGGGLDSLLGGGV